VHQVCLLHRIHNIYLLKELVEDLMVLHLLLQKL
jgi:hypothetical protein